MLKLLRKRKVAKKIFYFLAIIIVPAFVLWGSSSTISDRTTKGYAGKIFGKKISFNQYTYELQGWRTQLQLQYGEQAQQFAKFLNANKATWSRLILKHETKKRKIKVSDKELSHFIVSMPALQTDGVFDQQLYDLLLKYVFYMQPRVFEEYMRQTMQFKKLFNQVTNEVTITLEEVRTEHRARSRQIKVHYINSASKDFEKGIKLNDEDLKDYFQDKKYLFTIPIQINLQYLGFDYPEDASDEQKETIDDKAQELQEFLEDDTNDVDAALKTFQINVNETGYFSLGEKVPGLDWIPGDFESLFNLKENEVSQPMDTPRGPYLFLLKDKRIDYLPPFDETKDQVRDTMKKENAKEKAKAHIDQMYSQIKEKKELNPEMRLNQIADQLNLTHKETDFFNKRSSIPTIGSSPRFSEIAFRLSEGEISDIVEVESVYYIFSLLEEKPFDEEEFDEAKEDLKQELLETKKNKKFENFVEDLKIQANLIDLIPKNQDQSRPPQS